ncbi:MAG: hypothetical protein KGM43_01440 [Planctomycetota bacterium]|nr:hypothetical protein [Planctomycetota bacterium]
MPNDQTDYRQGPMSREEAAVPEADHLALERKRQLSRQQSTFAQGGRGANMTTRSRRKPA